MTENNVFKVVETEDGSPTLYNGSINEHYHSVYGAETESKMIFLNYGLEYWFQSHTISKEVNILEIGFGTALNAVLAIEYCINRKEVLNYHTIESNPISDEVYQELLRYYSDFQLDIFKDIHQVEWNEWAKVLGVSTIRIKKYLTSLLTMEIPQGIDVIFFDAFSPEVQPEMWTQDIFLKIYQSMNSGAVLTTYCAKGMVRRILQSIGFKVDRLPGPPHKREVLRAIK